MSVSFRPFEAEDLWRIDVQERHRWVLEAVQRRPLITGAMENTWSWTALEGSTVLSCVGAVDSEIWAFLARDLRRHMVPITRYGRMMMDAHVAVVGPLWAHIDPAYHNAVRWAELGRMRRVDGWLWVYDARSA